MNNKGFTIVELVIVIAVIAVLAAVMIPTFSGIIEKANISSDIQLVRNINTILKTESIGTTPPSTIDEFKTLLDKNGISEDDIKTPKYTVYWLKGEGVVILADGDNVPVYPEEYKYEFYDANNWIYYAGAGHQNVRTYKVTIKGNPTWYEYATHGRDYRSWMPLYAPGYRFTEVKATMNGQPVECKIELTENGSKVTVYIEKVTGNIELDLHYEPLT